MGKTQKILDSLWTGNTSGSKKGSGKTSAVDDRYVERFIADANSYMDTIDKIINGISYKTAKGTSYTQSRITDEFQERAKNVLDYLDENQDRYDPSDYTRLRSQVERFQGIAEEGRNAVRKVRDYYTQWETEEDYNAAMQRQSWQEKYGGKTHSELSPMLDALEDGEEKDWLTQYAGAVDYNERVNLDLNAADEEIRNLERSLNDAYGMEQMLEQYRSNPLVMLTNADGYRALESRYEAFRKEHGDKEKLEEQIEKKRQYRAESKQLQDGIQAEKEMEEWKKTVRSPAVVQTELDALTKESERLHEEYATLFQTMTGDPEAIPAGQSGDINAVAERIKVLEEKQKTLEKELNYGKLTQYTALMDRSDFAEKSKYIPSDQAKGIYNPLSGDYTMGDVKYDYINRNQQTIMQQTINEQRSGAALVGMGMDWLQQMQDDEIAIYNYLHRTKGADTADEYIAFLRPTLTARQRQGMEKTMQDLAQATPLMAPIVMSGISVGMSPLRGFSLVGQAADYLTDGRIDQNAGYNQFSYMPSAIRKEVTQKIQDSGKWGSVGSFAYQTAMSMGDFLMNAGVGMGIPGVSTAIMGSGAAADTVIRAKDRGLDDDQAFALGIVAGLAEAVSEHFSLEKLLDADLLMSGIGKYVLANTITEGSEEVASSIINMVADILITKEKSEWQEAIRGFKDQGYSEEEAFGKALAQQAQSLGMDFLGGALSGGIMSGATSATYYADTRRTGRAMGRRGLTDADQVQQILDTGANAKKGTAANAVAGQLQKKIDAGGQLSTYDKGRLYQSNPQAVGEAVFGQGSVSLATPYTQGIDNQDERWQQAQRLSSITGRNIKFYNGPENENGYFDKKSGEIFVNTNATDTVAQVVSHELTHSTELADSYQDLARYVRGKLRAEGKTWDALIQAKSEAYAAQGHPLESNKDAEAEIVAEYVQKHLLTNEQEIYEAVWESPTLGQRILNWIDGILARMNNQKAKERQMLNNAREVYARALEESRNKRTASQTNRNKGTQKRREPDRQQYAQEDLDYLDQLHQEQYNRGEITEEEYDQYLAWREHEAAAEEGAEELGRQYSLFDKSADQEKGVDKFDSTEENIANKYEQRGVHNDHRRIREGTAEAPETSESYGRANSENARNTSESPDWGNLDDLARRRITNTVNKNLKASSNSGELFSLLCDLVGRTDDNVTEYMIRKATKLLSEQIYKDAVSMNPILFEDRWSIFGDKTSELRKAVLRDVEPNTRQYSLTAATVSKKDVARDLRAILIRGGDPRELQRYVDRLEQTGRKAEQNDENRYRTGANRYQTGENRNSTAQEILEEAHSQGQSVEEYLRWNPEQFEVEGRWRSEALEAMRLEQSGRRYSLNTENPYHNLSLAEDSQAYTYAFLTSLPDMKPVILSDIADIRDEKNRINTSKVIELGRKNALSVGEERDGEIYVRNRYTGRELKITNASIRHGLEGSMNRLLTNARLGSVIGEVVQNAVPINALHNKAQGVEGTYAMAGYATDTDGREFVAIITVEQRNGTVEGIDVYDLTHAVSGRQKKRQPVGHEVPGNYPPSVASEISIEDFLPIVKDVYQSILPQDVLDHMGESRNPKGHYSDKVKFSLNEESGQQETEESQARVIQRDNLPAKARSYLARAENKLMNSIGEALSVPRYARYNSLKGIIQEISDTYLEENTISDEKMSELFDKAYAEGIVADAAFYDQYKEIKDHLRTYGVTLSDRDKGDIADFEDFRKRAFGTLRILNEGGVPVDTAYQELQTMAPELFPDSITHPADQLVRMLEVGQSITISKKSLDEYYGPEKEEFRKWAKNDFHTAVADAFRDLKQVKRYAEGRATSEDSKRILTVEEAEEAFQELKKLRRNVDKVRAKNLLTESDEILLGRMLKGEIGPQHLNPKEDNIKGITAMYEAKLAYESQVELLAAYKRSVKAKRMQDADRFLENARTWKDKRAGILYARETMRRNIMDIVPDKKLAEQIAEHYFEAVHMAEAKSTKFKNEYRDRVRALNLSTKVIKGNMVSEAHAVQLLGEAMDNIRVMENSRGRMGMRDGKTLAEWRAVVDDLWMNNTGLDRQKVERAVEEFRKIYDELFQQMNRIRVENGYEPVNYRQGYFPHFQPGGDGIMAFFGKVMGINTQVDALPTTINGLTHTFKPGIQWFGNAQERIGFNTAYDAVEGFDKYIEGVASVIFQTENIQKLRALSTQARYRTSDEGIRKQVDAVRMDDRLSEEEKQREINAIYEHGKFSLSNFVAELDEYTNLLANKKSKYDRTMESLIGRRAYTLMKAWENRVGANMIAGNISSALTNFIPMTQAGAQLDSGMMLKGMWDTLRNMREGDNLAGMSDFLTNRRGSDVLVKNWMQKTSGVLGTPMELIDNFTSEAIVRAAYLQNLKRGLSEAEAMHQADIFAAGVMADRSKGAMPTLFESRNPLFKAFTQFQLEVNNQFSEVFKDLPRNHREKGAAALALILLKYFLGAWMYNELFEKVIGRRSALDPIGILLEAGEDLTGYEIPNIFDMIFDGEQIEKKSEGSIGEAGANLAANVLSELPFSAGLNLFGVETDGGRLPAASAVPDLSALWEAATEEGWTSDQRWKHIQDELNKLAYVLPPFGGGQISKTWKGIDAYLKGGSYGMDKNGEEILQYPVYKDEPQDAFWSLVRAAFLGKNSLPEAQEWVADGYDSLNAFQTVVYKDMLDAGVKDREAFALIQDIREVSKTETEDGARHAANRRLVMQSELSDEGKAIAYYGLVATDKEKDWMNKLADAGADQGQSLVFIQNLYDTEKLKGTEKKEAQAAVFLDSQFTEEEKKVAIRFIMDTDLETEAGNPTQYAKFLTSMETGLTVDKYMEIRSSGTDIDDYLELTDVGIKGNKAADLSMSMATLEPEDGYENVSWIQRCRTVMDSDLSDQEKLQALQTVDGIYESTYEKIVTGHNFGMNVNSYIDLKSIMPQYDENGNGTYTQAETEAAINALAGDDNSLFALTGTTPNGYTLTNREKAILWQLQNKSWKPYRNPFDKEVGQMVYDYMTAEDPAEAMPKSGTELDLSSLFG